MNEIYFFTSNRTKLANLKHIARSVGLQVLGFRERTYRGPYEEPRIRNRKNLLARSYESAAAKWAKAFDEFDPRVFILEDTSVKIDALSTRREVPGVDVKFWMQGMSFAKLDSLLKANGNIRTATVRSDIGAHIPRRLRSALGLGDSFIWTYGETKGRIIDRESTVSSNLVYPWLDDRSFNRWFAPDGFDLPLSSLPIADADRCDFRRKSFLDLVQRFKGLLAPAPIYAAKQLLLPGFSAPPVWVICGLSCAGKTTIAQWLSDHYGFLHLEASDFMRQAYWERHGMGSQVDISEFALAALAVEPWIAAKPIASEIRRLGFPAVVVTGFRSPAELESLQQHLGQDRPVTPIFLDADENIRFARAQCRRREAVSEASFQMRDSQEFAMGIQGIRALAAKQTIANNFQTILPFARTFEKLFSSDIGILSQAAQENSGISMGNLEQLIVLGLLNADGQALTTAQIAQSIDFYFKESKSKNNVSRYFNQEFHPFYRADIMEGKVRYRLSATGMSIAKLLEVFRNLR